MVFSAAHNVVRGSVTLKSGWGLVVTFQKRILEWQAEHPYITWGGWAIVWAHIEFGGEGGKRTHGTVTRTTVFEF